MSSIIYFILPPSHHHTTRYLPSLPFYHTPAGDPSPSILCLPIPKLPWAGGSDSGRRYLPHHSCLLPLLFAVMLMVFKSMIILSSPSSLTCLSDDHHLPFGRGILLLLHYHSTPHSDDAFDGKSAGGEGEAKAGSIHSVMI